MPPTRRSSARALTASLAAGAVLAGSLTVATAAAPPAQAAPIAAQASLSAPGAGGASGAVGTPLIGERTTVRLEFDNPADDGTVGYGPRVDLYLDATGADGAGAEADDGVTFVSASYLGQAVPAEGFTIPELAPGEDEDGTFLHPVLTEPRPIPAGFARGDELVVLSLPFGSFTPGQPTVEVDVVLEVSELADNGVELPVVAQPWYRYGFTELDDPRTDPPAASYGTGAAIALAPQLYRLTQRYIGPEGETATGPSYEREYEVSLDIAAGQTITDVELAQAFGPEIVLVGTGPSQTAPAGATSQVTGDGITVRWPSVTGTSSGSDASFRYRYHVGETLTGSEPVLDPATGASRSTVATATAHNLWLATDDRDNTVVPCVPVDHDGDPETPEECTEPPTVLPTEIEVGPVASGFAERSLAIQKSANRDDVVPGNEIVWTASVQVSDYFAFGDLAIDDIVGDGLDVLDDSFTIAWPGQPATALTAGEVAVGPRDEEDGSTPIRIDLSEALARLAAQSDPFATGGFAVGTLVDTVEQGPSRLTIEYRTEVAASFATRPAEDRRAMSPGDSFGNDIEITGRIARVEPDDRSPACEEPEPAPEPEPGEEPGEPGEEPEPCPEPHGEQPYLTTDGQATVANGSGDGVRIPQGSLVQSVYARNGVVGVSSSTRFAPGDTITYRIRQSLPVQSYESLELTDYFPLPVQRVSAIGDEIGTIPGGAVPAVGALAWGPDHDLDPAAEYEVLRGTSSNSLTIDFGTRDVPDQSGGVVIDILVTVRISDDPFADGLLLTNQVRSEQTNSFTDAAASTALAQFVLAEPDLEVYKGVLATSSADAVLDPALPPALAAALTAPGSAASPRWDADEYRFTSASLAEDAYPLGTRASDLVAGDVVTYAIVVQNTGRSPNGAFDVRVADGKSPFLVEPTGPQGYNLQVRYGNGEPADFTGSADDLFGASGITIVDGEQGGTPMGGIPAFDEAADGANVVVITYDLQVALEAEGAGSGALTALPNTAEVLSWRGSPTGGSFAGIQDGGEITITTKGVEVEKEFLGAEESSGERARVGERVRYRITVDVPPGRYDDLVVEDLLGDGLGFVSLDSAMFGEEDVSGPGHLDFTRDGSSLQAVFGLLQTTVGAELVLEYTAEVLNLASVDAGDLLANDAWAGDYLALPAGPARDAERDAGHAEAPDLVVIEPGLDLALAHSTATSPPDAGDGITWTATIGNDSGVDAFDVVVRIPVPARVSSPDDVEVDVVAGSVAGAVTEIGPDGDYVEVRFAELPAGARVDVSFDTVLGAGIGDGTVQTTATLRWASLPTGGDHGEIRDGSGTPAHNDYHAEATETIALSGGALVKTIEGTSYAVTPEGGAARDLAIGEVASFLLDVRLPEGDLEGVVVTDVLPAGMALVGDDTSTVEIAAPGFSASGPNPALDATTSYAAGTRTLEIDLGDLVLPGDNSAEEDHVLIRYDAVLRDDTTAFPASTGSAQDAKAVQNRARLEISGTDPVADDAELRYVQPRWALTNTVTSSPARPNDTVSFELQATNQGAVAAKDAALTFRIPNAYAAGSAQTVDPASLGVTLAPSVASAFTWASSRVEDDLVVTFTPVDDGRFPALGSGSPQFGATVTAAITDGRPAGSPFTPRFTAAAKATSTTAADFAAPATGPLANRDVVRQADRQVQVRIPDVGVVLTRSPGATNVDAGTEITWSLRPTVASIRTENVRVWAVVSEDHEVDESSISHGGSYHEATRTVSWPVIAGPIEAGASVPARSFRTTVVNPAPVDPVTVSVTAHASNRLVDGGGELTEDYAHGADPDELPSGGNNVATASAGVVASPDLMPTITDGVAAGTPVAPGGTIHWEVAVRNVGDRDTASGAVSVTIPPGVRLTGQDAAWTVTPNDEADGGPGTVLTWSGIELDGIVPGAGSGGSNLVDETGTAWIEVRVDDRIRAGQYTIDGVAVTSDPGDANPGNDRASDPTALGGSPELAIDKELETTGDLVPGATASWLVTVSNDGTRGAEGLEVTDLLPEGLTLSTVSFAQVSGTPVVTGTRDGREITWAGGVLEAGESAGYRVSATIASPADAGRESLANLATASEDGRNGVDEDAPSYPLTDSVTSPLVAAPDVSVAVTNGVTRLVPGTASTYTVTATNDGDQTEAGATLRLRIPADMTVGAVSGGGVLSGTGDDRVVTWTGIGIPGDGGSVVRTVVLTPVSPQPAGATSKLVTAEIDTSAEDVDKSDNTATDEDPLGGAPALAIVKTADATEPEPGDTVVYTLTVTNSGPRGASGVVIVDELPEGVSFVSASGGGAHEDGVVTWDGPRTIPGGGGTASVTVTVRVGAPAPASLEELLNVARAHDDGENTGPEVSGDPVRRASTDLELPVVAAPDYAVDLEVDAATAEPGDELGYRLEVENVGTQDGADGELVVTLPSGVSVVDADGGDASAPGRIVFRGLDLAGATEDAAGGQAAFDLVLRVDDPLVAGLRDLPVAAAVEVDGDTRASNDEDSVTTALAGGPRLVVEKTATAEAAPGDTITWQLVVTNTGDRGAEDVTLEDSLPAGIGAVSWVSAERERGGATTAVATGVVTGGTIALAPGVVEVGDVYTYTFSAEAETASAGVEELVNRVEFGPIGDENGVNTSTAAELADSATTEIDASPDLSVAITDARGELVIGTDAGSVYTVTVTNVGDQDTTTGEARVVIPSWLTPTSHTGTAVPGGTLIVLSGLTVEVGTPTTLTIPVAVPSWVAAGVETATATATASNGATDGVPNEDGASGTKSASDDTTVVAVPELVVTAERSGTGRAGSETGWAFEVVNVGTQGATGVEFVATLPRELVDSVETDPAGASEGGTELELSWPAFALDPGDAPVAFEVLTELVRSFPAGLTHYEVSGRAADDGENGPEAVLANNTATLTVAVVDAPDMRVVHVPTALPLEPGEEFEVELRVENQGPMDTLDAVLRVVIPAGLTVVPSPHDADGRSLDGPDTIEWTGLDVAGDSSETVSRVLRLRLDDPQPAGRSAIALDSTVTTTDDTVTRTSDKTARTTVTLAGAPDLSVTQAVDAETAVAGDAVTWTVVVDNVGVRGASGVTVAMTVPEAVDGASLAPGGGSWDPTTRTITWTIPVLEVDDAPVVLTVVGVLHDPIPLTGSQLASQVVVSDDGLNGADPDLTNNVDSTGVTTGADLRVTKALTDWRAVRGSEVSWVITVANEGPAVVTGLRVDEQLPGVLEHVSMVAREGAYDPVTREWTGLELAPGESADLVVTALVRADARGTRLVNTVEVSPIGLNPVDLETLSATSDVPLMSPLAATGLGIAPVVLLVLLLVALGVLLLAVPRRRGRHSI